MTPNWAGGRASPPSDPAMALRDHNPKSWTSILKPVGAGKVGGSAWKGATEGRFRASWEAHPSHPCLPQQGTEVTKQKRTTSTKSDKMLLLSEPHHATWPGLCLPGTGGHSNRRKRKRINVLWDVSSWELRCSSIISEFLTSLSDPCGGVLLRWRALLSLNLDLEAQPSSCLAIGTPEHNLAQSLQSEGGLKALHGIVTAFPE